MALSAASLWTLAKEIVALFGGLCLVFNVLLPAATLALQLVAHDAPEQLGQWRRHRAQQHELAQLTARIERLARKQARIERKHKVHKARTNSSNSNSNSSNAKSTVRRRTRSVDNTRKRARASDTAALETPLPLSLPQRRHRLSIYSTAEKHRKAAEPPLDRDATDTVSQHAR